MLRQITILIVVLISFGSLYSQSISGLHIYNELSPFKIIIYGHSNESGYKYLLRDDIDLGDTSLQPGVLIQLDHDGNLLSKDTLREYGYNFMQKVDSLLFLGAFHYKKWYKDSITFIFEICDLNGKVIEEYSQDFYQNIPSSTGYAVLNDSVCIITQICYYYFDQPIAVHYFVNYRSLNVRRKLVNYGAVLGKATKIDDKPTYLEWGYALYKKDTTFLHNNKIETDTAQASNPGVILPRENNSGWFGFGGCSTPSNFYGICMIALDKELNLDKVDLLYHSPIDNFDYYAATLNSICRSGNSYYGAGVWNALNPSLNFFKDTFATHMVLVKYDLQLNRVWTKLVGGDRRYKPFEVHPTKAGGFMVSGGLRDNLDNYKIAPFTMFFDADGELVGTEEEHAPDRFAFTIYGNPGREALRIMAETGARKVLLQVVNAMGQPRLHRHLVDGMNEFDTAFWPSGTYLMSITDEQGQVLWSQPWIRE